MAEFGGFLLEILKWGLLIFGIDLFLALAFGTIFGAYFNCKKKFLREMKGMNNLDQTDGE